MTRDRSTPDVVMVFVKAPSPGQVKTRLLPALSPEEAAALYRCLVDGTLDVVTRLQGIQVVVAYAPDARFPDLAWLGPSLTMIVQHGPTLGDRLVHAFEWAFAQGARRVIALGSDAPDLSTAWVQEALDALTRNDVVIGPTTDGGYHLIGLTCPRPELFVDMPWSSPEVLATTRERIGRLRLRVHQLAPVSDVDTPQDMQRYLSVGSPRPSCEGRGSPSQQTPLRRFLQGGVWRAPTYDDGAAAPSLTRS